MTGVLDPTRVKEILTDGILLHDISWSTYESLLRDHPDAASPRLTYDRGDLLIMVSSPEHEEINRTLSLLVELLAEEFEVESRAFGSTTYKRKVLHRGFEPDSCFYFKKEARMRGKKSLDLTRDPPPDLVVEIDITSPSINQLPLFAEFGIPEVWRFHGQEMEILFLEETISAFLHESFKIGRLAWIKTVRGWAQQVKVSAKTNE
jgi:Uma2 family endonuclease